MAQVASSVASSTQTLQPPEQASQVLLSTLVLSAGPTTAPLSRASGWETGTPASGDQGYTSPLIDLYPDQDLDLEALYGSPDDRAPVSCDLQEVPSGSS